jgi:hypothetical protein
MDGAGMDTVATASDGAGVLSSSASPAEGKERSVEGVQQVVIDMTATAQQGEDDSKVARLGVQSQRTHTRCCSLQLLGGRWMTKESEHESGWCHWPLRSVISMMFATTGHTTGQVLRLESTLRCTLAGTDAPHAQLLGNGTACMALIQSDCGRHDFSISGLAMAGAWGIYTPRLSFVAPGFRT